MLAQAVSTSVDHRDFVPNGQSGIDQPIPQTVPQMEGRARSQIEGTDFQKRPARAVRMFHIKMAARYLREQAHCSEDQFRERPIRVVEDQG